MPDFLVPASPFDESERMTSEEYDESFCTCKEPDIWMEISDGDLTWDCHGCKKPMSDWFTEMVTMDPIKVSMRIEPGHCTCNMYVQLSCDCGQWPVVKPVMEGEDVNDKEAAGG